MSAADKLKILFGKKDIKWQLTKLYYLVTKEDYWRAVWDHETRKYGEKMIKPGCVRSPLTNPEKQQYIIKKLSLNKTDVFLDVGCAAAPLVKEASRHVKLAKGFDLSNELVHLANKNLEGIANVEVKQGSVIEIPFQSQMFNKVCCCGVLQYLSRNDVFKAFQELFRVTKQKGHVFVVDLPKPVKRRWLDIKVQLFDPENIIGLSSEVGFTIEQLDDFEATFDMLLQR